MSESAGVVVSHVSLQKGSKSFALASKLLPASVRDDVAVVYAWCRRADDAIDDAPKDTTPAALARLRRELDDVYAGAQQSDPTLAAFQATVRRRGVPIDYPRELLLGMEMDVSDTVYRTELQLLLYCYRVAGVVGLMMCHLLGVRRREALRHATHLGIAMQLTNIARDVQEDWTRGRRYIPDAWLGDAPPSPADTPEIDAARAKTLAPAVERLLTEADKFYRSADLGLFDLPWRAALGVRAARLIYHAIGGIVAVRAFDVTKGRAVVSLGAKLWFVARALVAALVELPRRMMRPFVPAQLSTSVRFPDDVLPL